MNSLRAYEPQLSLEVSIQTWLALKVLISVQLALARQDVKEKKRYACWREWNRPPEMSVEKSALGFPAAGQQLTRLALNRVGTIGRYCDEDTRIAYGIQGAECI